MMSFIFLALLAAMLFAFCGKKSLGYILFATSVLIGLYWFNHHANDALSILL